MRLQSVLALSLCLVSTSTSDAQERVPGDGWLRFADPTQAGFDISELEAARETWEQMPSSAFMVIADGAVVAAWGDVDRRFMCHSVRKSFLSALYGVYWDRGEIELNKTLDDLGMDDEPSPLMETEKTARILDLLKARSGVFHPAAYAGRTDGRPRGSEGAGRYFAYNNWDFNTLATILEMETGDSVFEAFDEHFGIPLGMEDWRVTDGYFHYERDKSKYPAYPFRMSARDAARFGLLFARSGMWADESVLSRHWVKRSTGLYSIDSDIMGYGFMWWVFLEPRFERHGMVSALGVGNQMIAALPDSDIVIVNRANTYVGENTPMEPLLDLIEAVLASRTGEVAPSPRLVPLESRTNPRITHVDSDSLGEFVGEWTYPPPVMGSPATSSVDFEAGPGHLVTYADFEGTFRLHIQPDGSWYEEDTHRFYMPVRDEAGAFNGICGANFVVNGAMEALAVGNIDRAQELMDMVDGRDVPMLQAGRALVDFLVAVPDEAEDRLRQLAEHSIDLSSDISRIALRISDLENPDLAHALFALNTRLFPQAFEAWTGLAETQLKLGDIAGARQSFERALELNPQSGAVRRKLDQLR